MQRALLRFDNAVKSDATREKYNYYLNRFLKYAKINRAEGLLQLKDEFLQRLLEDYLFHLKKCMGPNSIPPHFAAIELFLAINDKNLNFKKVRKMFPARLKKTGGRSYTTAQVRQMLEVTANLPPDWKLEQTILPQLIAHRGQWVGMTECDHEVCKIDYVGPIKSNPYSHGIPGAGHSFKIPDGADPYQVQSSQIQPTSYSDGTNTQDRYPAELEQDFTAESSNVANVDLQQNLNSWTGSNTNWIQSVLMYDEANFTGTPGHWYMEMDSHDPDGTDDFGTSIPTKMITTNTNTDSFQEFLWAMGNSNGSTYDGCYEAEVNDVTSAHLQTAEICESTDTAATLYLNSELNTGGIGDSGSMTEEWDSDNTSVYYWSKVQGDIPYTLGFYDNYGGTKYTTMTQGWTSTNTSNPSAGDLYSQTCSQGLSITESNNQDTQKFIKASGC